MFSATKFNKGGGANFIYKLPEGSPFKKLSDYGEGKKLTVRGLAISKKGKYGDSPVLITDGEGVWLPGHLTDTIREMCSDPECVEAINQGCVAAVIYAYVGENGNGFSVRWEDQVPTVSNEFTPVSM